MNAIEFMRMQFGYEESVLLWIGYRNDRRRGWSERERERGGIDGGMKERVDGFIEEEGWKDGRMNRRKNG